MVEFVEMVRMVPMKYFSLSLREFHGINWDGLAVGRSGCWQPLTILKIWNVGRKHASWSIWFMRQLMKAKTFKRIFV